VQIATKHKFPYNWTLANGYPAKGIEDHKSKVFSCFCGGGGSTMGYKLAGYDVIGCNEIDQKMMMAYQMNHQPKYAALEPIQTFKLRKDLPESLYNLDILDGSPPCSSFSEAGSREKDWGKEKRFREGQAKQILDTLFFDFLELAKELQPKTIIAENVTGILKGNAFEYSKKIVQAFLKAGYKVKVFTLDASKMGVPQKRKRVFFIGVRNDIAARLPVDNFTLFNDFPAFNLVFNEKEITLSEIKHNCHTRPVNGKILRLLNEARKGERDLRHACKRIEGKGNNFACSLLYENEAIRTILAQDRMIVFNEKRQLSDIEYIRGGAFPSDYNFMNNSVNYVIGMSVPPVMIAQIADRIFNQWLKGLKL